MSYKASKGRHKVQIQVMKEKIQDGYAVQLADMAQARLSRFRRDWSSRRLTIGLAWLRT